MNAKSTGESHFRRELFQPSIEGEARLLLLINEFSGKNKCLEGRTKLAKLDFFLRYPAYLKRALEIRAPQLNFEYSIEEGNSIESRMVRYRYGPWDPSYYSLLGRLIGKGLVETIAVKNGLGYRTTSLGRSIAREISTDEVWEKSTQRIALLRRHLNLQGSSLMKFVYDNFPEVTDASWGDKL